MSKDIFCTLGPASMNKEVITRLTELGATLFRINLSHTRLEDLADVIKLIRSYTNIPVCLDTEGAQVRTSTFVDGKISIKENEILEIPSKQVRGTAKCFNLYPSKVFEDLEQGDFISIDFNAVLVRVVKRHEDVIKLRVLHGGEIGSNKAVTVERPLVLPALTDKDIAALKIGRSMDIKHVALSFANFASDVKEIRIHAGDDALVISKIECRNGVQNLEKIAALSDAILIDRGDLSREFPVEHIPALQKQITVRSKAIACKVHVATNLLESMITASSPTRAEVNDVHNTLTDGVDGLVLAAETAIGKNPIACVSMIVKLIRSYEAGNEMTPEDYISDPASLLIEPHGGKLIRNEVPDFSIDNIAALHRVCVSDHVLMDCQQIGIGTFSPLAGFMGKEELDSVIHKNCLPDGTVWPLPITLQLDEESLQGCGVGDQIALQSKEGKIHALINISEIFVCDVDSLSVPWFGTDSTLHPGVTRLTNGGKYFVAGEVTLVEHLSTPFREFELTPSQTRFLFTRKGWSSVIGFHSRNVAHRVHEYIQLKALEDTVADGLYISPVIGPRKSGDFLPGPILHSYQAMIDKGVYPNGKVALGGFSTYPRYGGPREAVFTALCRKNIGCSHFIVGRDHTGVSDFYKPEESQKFFDLVGDIGIKLIFFDEITYDLESKAYMPRSQAGNPALISGSRVRQAILNNDPLPEWLMRDVVQEYLQLELACDREIISK